MTAAFLAGCVCGGAAGLALGAVVASVLAAARRPAPAPLEEEPPAALDRRGPPT